MPTRLGDSRASPRMAPSPCAFFPFAPPLMSTRKQSTQGWSESICGAPTSSSKLSSSPRPDLGGFTFLRSLQSDGNQNPVNQFVGKALRYDYVSMAVTAVPRRPNPGSGLHLEGKGLGVVKDMCMPFQSHFHLPPHLPTLAFQKHPK